MEMMLCSADGQPLMAHGLPSAGWRVLWWIKSKHKETLSQISFAVSMVLYFPLPVWGDGGSHLPPRLFFSFWVFQVTFLSNGQGVLPLCCLLCLFLLPFLVNSYPSVMPVFMFPHISNFKALHMLLQFVFTQQINGILFLQYIPMEKKNPCHSV